MTGFPAGGTDQGSPAPDRGIRVALLSPCFWPEVRRGTERFLRDLADGLIERGHSPRLITSHPHRPRHSVEDGLPITRHWRPPQGPLRRLAFEDHLSHLPFSYLSLVRGDDAVAHAVFPTDGVAAARWSARTGRPSVMSYMGIPRREWLKSARLRLWAAREATRGCNVTVALSRVAAMEFRRTLGVEARVIHPGVDTEVFTPGDARFEQPTIFCGAALEEPRKRVELLLRAFPLVRRELPDARLLLSRPRDPALTRRLEEAQEGLALVDVDEREDLVNAYRRSWVSVLPSVGEAFGLVLAEALACGTPVVATDVDGMREIVDRESLGRLFRESDGEAGLARALLETLELARSPGTREECRARAEPFSKRRCVDAYEELYRELLG